MYNAYNESTPTQLKSGEWHLPLVDDLTDDILNKFLKEKNIKKTKKNRLALKIKVSTARCARTSYTVFGKDVLYNFDNDLRLHDTLIKSKHASPAEHLAMATNNTKYYGNFKGFKQYRKILESKKILNSYN
jgi:hypothetical protein